jgi:hypothetical protein
MEDVPSSRLLWKKPEAVEVVTPENKFAQLVQEKSADKPKEKFVNESVKSVTYGEFLLAAGTSRFSLSRWMLTLSLFISTSRRITMNGLLTWLF